MATTFRALVKEAVELWPPLGVCRDCLYEVERFEEWRGRAKQKLAERRCAAADDAVYRQHIAAAEAERTAAVRLVDEFEEPDPRSWTIHRNRRGWPAWYQRWLEAWWIITGKWSLHRAWQEGVFHGTAMEYKRTVVMGDR